MENEKMKIFKFEKNSKWFILKFDVLSLRVFEIWQWSNNEKVSIFPEEYDFHIFIGARALPRALRATLYTPKNMDFGNFSEYMMLCAHKARA